MNSLDFLSSSPRNFIFQNPSNKTNLGGVLSLIYLIIILLISAFYITSYILNDKYIVEYFLNHHAESDYLKEENREALIPNRNIPYFNLELILQDKDSDKYLIDRLYLLEKKVPNEKDAVKTYFNTSEKYYSKSETEQYADTTIYKMKKKRQFINGYEFGVYYECQEYNCSDVKNIFDFDMSFEVFYNQFNISHQDNIPLYQIQNTTMLTSSGLIFDDFKRLFGKVQHTLKWDIIKYKEEKGFLSLFDRFKEENSDKYLYGLFLESKEEKIIEPYSEINKSGFICLFNIVIDINYEHHEEYSRKVIGLIDVIANICSLSLTIFNAFTFLFYQIYSKNFDNYKIVQNILSNKENIKPQINIELNNQNSPFLFDNKKLNINSDEDFIIGKNKHKGKKHIDDIDELDLNELDNDNKILLPKLHLCDYVLNNICCKKCITSKKQMLITECNYILSKYFSVEKIILNQLIFENLLSDYNWNELSLEEFENNQNISRLKKYI